MNIASIWKSIVAPDWMGQAHPMELGLGIIVITQCILLYCITKTLWYHLSGTCAAEQTEPVPFVIEWIPDILPHSQVGELRIRFEYGHQLGSKPEHCKSSAGTERTEQTVADAIPQQ